MTAANLAWLVAAAAVFIAAAASAKLYVLDPRWAPLVAALSLYTVGNLMIIRAMREVGLALALSVSAVAQLVAVNVIALAIFRERLSGPQYAGVALGILAVALIVLFPAGEDSGGPR
jgi:small multidrug resistance pump